MGSRSRFALAVLLVTLVPLFALPFISQAAVTELVVNGSFETGSFSGWTTNYTGASPYCTNWAVRSGNFTTCNPPVNPSTWTPVDGTYMAVNGFDGNAGQYTMWQNITLPQGSAGLSFKFRAITDHGGVARTMKAQLRAAGGGAVLATLYQFTTTPGSVVDTGWISVSADLTAFAGQTVSLYFVEDIPEDFSGPGAISFDAISVLATPGEFGYDVFVPGDARINHETKDRSAPVAVYCQEDSILVLKINPANGKGIDPAPINMPLADAEAKGIPTDANLLLAENDGVQLWRLTSGEFQVNTVYPNEPGKPWVFVWDACPVTKSYHLAN